MAQLQVRHEDPDLPFPIICATLASAAAKVDFALLENFGGLAQAIFDRIAEGGAGGESGLFSAEAVSRYAQQTETLVDTAQVQNMLDRMIAASLIHRQSHGVYAISDPFVREVWRRRKSLVLNKPGV